MKNDPVEEFHIDEESQQIIDQLYLITPTTMTLPDGSTVDVPEYGSIGILASGYRGIIAWRKQREKVHGSRLYSPYAGKMKKENDKKKGKQDE
jgi:hypothetical protein